MIETWLWVVAGVIVLFGFVVFRGAPYVPSHRKFAKEALEDLYPLGKKDLLIDLGSGDGVILRLAAAKGTRAIGYELNPALVLISKFLSRKQPLAETRLADFWLIDLPKEVTVVYAFAVTRDMPKLARKLQRTADKTEHAVSLITYGLALANKEPVKQLKAHRLYVFEPAQATLQMS